MAGGKDCIMEQESFMTKLFEADLDEVLRIIFLNLDPKSLKNSRYTDILKASFGSSDDRHLELIKHDNQSRKVQLASTCRCVSRQWDSFILHRLWGSRCTWAETSFNNFKRQTKKQTLFVL